MSVPQRSAVRRRLSKAIVLADFAFVNGGNGKVGLSTAVSLAHSGIDTIFFAATGPIDDTLRGVDGLRTICLDQAEFLTDPNLARGAIRGLWNFAAAREFRAVLRECDPADTVVHVHSWTKALSSSVVQAAIDANFSVVMTIHDYFAFCPNGSLYDHAKRSPCRLQPMSARCITANCDSRSRTQKMYRVARQLITDRVAGIPERTTNFIALSPFSRAVAEPHLGSSRIFDVPNPIDAMQEPPADAASNEEFVYVGRLSPEKGPDLFARAAEMAGARAAFIGDGPLAREMRAIAPSAEFTGWLDRAGVRARLRRARALVFPSRWYEASPLVVPEAAAMGIPSIVADDCAASRSIVDGITGLTFRSNDAADLAEKIRALTDGSLAATLGRAAYERFWASPPLMSRHIADLRAVYETILADRAS